MDQLKELYERQDTEELLEIARKDLTDVARTVLQDVLAARGIGIDLVTAARTAAIIDETTAARAESNLASRWVRLLAFVLDVWGVMLVFFLVLLPLRFWSTELHVNATLFVWLAYFLFRDSIPGQSVGKRILRLRTVQVETGRSCTWSDSFWRNVTHLFFLIDVIFILGERRMRLGEMFAGTHVVRAQVIA